MNKYLEENLEIENFLNKTTDEINSPVHFSISEVFTEDFMLHYTHGQYSDILTLLNDAGFNSIESINDADETALAKLNIFLHSITGFVSWDEMCIAAMHEHGTLLGRI